MGKLARVISVVCSLGLIFSVPSVSSATLEDHIARVQKLFDKNTAPLYKRIEEIEKDIESKTLSLSSIDKEIGNLQDEIDDLLKQSEKETVNEDIVSKINSKKNDLEKEKKNCNECKEVLDDLTVALSTSGNDEDLLYNKSIAQENFDKSSKRVQELESELEKLEASKFDCKDLKSKLEKLKEEKLQHEKERDKLKEEIKKCEQERIALVRKIGQCKYVREREINEYKLLDSRYKELFEKWKTLSSGDQNENNVLDGQKIEKTCGIFAATNVINYYVSYFGSCDGLSITRGFNNVIQTYLSHGGKKENLNKTLGYEELKEYLNNFKFPGQLQYLTDEEGTDEEIVKRTDSKTPYESRFLRSYENPQGRRSIIVPKILPIYTYHLVYEERVCNIPDLKEEKRQQKLNVCDILISHFNTKRVTEGKLLYGRSGGPVLNLNRGHWQTFVAFNWLEGKMLLVDSSPARVEWVAMKDVLRNAVSVNEGRLHWNLVFFPSTYPCEDDYFGTDFGRPFTAAEKEKILERVKYCFE